MEEARGETLLWNELKENFIKDYDQLVEATKQIETFIKPIVNLTVTHNRPNASCHDIQSNKVPQSTRL